MKKRNQLTAFVQIAIALFLLAAPQLSKAQSTYKLAAGAGSSIKVLGSSNVHDWVMTSGVMESQGQFGVEGNELHSLSAFSFSVAFKTLKSEHTSMDDRTYKAVNAAKYPTIDYKLSSAVISSIDKNKFLIKTKGDLTISGKTQPVAIEVTAVINPDNTITCTGAKKIQLTDYGIKPPSFMLGAMKVTNDLTIQFTLIYKK